MPGIDLQSFDEQDGSEWICQLDKFSLLNGKVVLCMLWHLLSVALSSQGKDKRVSAEET